MWKTILLFMIPLCILCSPHTTEITEKENTTKNYDHSQERGQAPSFDKPYTDILTEVKAKKTELSESYKLDSADKDSCIKAARTFLLDRFATEIFPAWYGTEWDFNGVTRTPRKGKIACGYFVTTLIQDVGFRIPRIKWAQQISEHYIKRMAPDDIYRFSNKSVDVIVNSMKERGNGLYIVGLDSHVGFILVKDDHPMFVHSDYYEPNFGVMAEELDSDNPLKDSNYRVIGKMFSDEMMVNWLEGNVYTF